MGICIFGNWDKFSSLLIGFFLNPTLPYSSLKGRIFYPMLTVLLLTISNLFMTFAWYGHLKYKDITLWKVVLMSWGIAFFEYCFMVPANRFGHGQFNATELKTVQEAITLIVFSLFSIFYLKEDFKWNYAVGFLMIFGAVVMIFKEW